MDRIIGNLLNQARAPPRDGAPDHHRAVNTPREIVAQGVFIRELFEHRGVTLVHIEEAHGVGTRIIPPCNADIGIEIAETA
jgi:hypothetical protein